MKLSIKIFRLYVCLILLSLVWQSAAQTTAGTKLTVGDKAPELKIEKWLKGGGFTNLREGKVYMVDMWATWCVPCIAGMPHLSRLQEKYKAQGLEVIGVTNNDAYGNSYDSVVKFVKEKSNILKYNVAWTPESSNGSLRGVFVHPWMQQAGTMNLPTVFLVDRSGTIAYIGDPHTVDNTLDAVMSGSYDITSLKSNYLSGLKAEGVYKLFDSALKKNDLKAAILFGKQILNDYSFVKVNTLLTLGSRIASFGQTNADTALLEIGLEAARRGVVLTKFESPGFLSTLASVYAAKKDYVLAVMTQILATSVSEGGMKTNQLKELEKYREMLRL